MVPCYRVSFAGEVYGEEGGESVQCRNSKTVDM